MKRNNNQTKIINTKALSLDTRLNIGTVFDISGDIILIYGMYNIKAGDLLIIHGVRKETIAEVFHVDEEIVSATLQIKREDIAGEIQEGAIALKKE